MAIRGDKVTLVTPKLLEIVNDLVERHGSRAEVARRAGMSRSPLSALYADKLLFMHATILGKLLKLHGGYSKKDFEWYTRAELLANFGIKTSPTLKTRIINGVRCRYCRHPDHKGERWIPFSEFHRGNNGTPRSWCRVCETRQKGAEPYYPVNALVRAATVECVHRLGKYETARRGGMTVPTLMRIYSGRALKIQRRTARKILLLRQEIQLSGEIRHKKSISHGSKARGHDERKIIDRKDYYVPSGDDENFKRQERRRKGGS